MRRLVGSLLLVLTMVGDATAQVRGNPGPQCGVAEGSTIVLLTGQRDACARVLKALAAAQPKRNAYPSA